jgi:sec-independent protein translocase protein TatB
VFGLGFGEMVVLGIVLLVVVGPKELPKLLRALGQGIRKLKSLSTDLREQSGIDEIIRDENLREDLDALRSLSRGRVVDSLVRDTMRNPKRVPRLPRIVPTDQLRMPEGEAPSREDEYPIVGPDTCGAYADDAEIPEPPAEAEGSIEEPPPAASADGEPVRVEEPR